MTILEPPPNPATPPTPEPVKLRTGRFGEMEEHELIHLIDALDDERSRARFRESIYISIFIYLILFGLSLYLPNWLPKPPRLVNEPIKQEHDQMTSLNLPKDLERQLARQPHPAPRPAPPVSTPQPTPAPQAATQPQPAPARPTPPVNSQPTPQPPMPQPQPRPAPPQQQAMIPDAPKPNFNRPSQSPGDAIAQAMRDAARAQGGADGPSGVTRGGHSPLAGGAEILTDTQGVDFNPWLRRFKSDVMRNWEPLIPESVAPPISKRGMVGIRITIAQGGKILNVVRESPSGDQALDKAAWNALISEGTYPPLPKEFPGPSIEIRCSFLYNETPQ
jgi:TonB family protein